MIQIIAIAGLTIKESVRKKVFLVLALFGIILVCSTFFFPSVKPEDKIILAQTWSQRAIIFFGMLIAVFISSMSLPEDIEEKKLFMVLTKPIPRRSLLLGKYLGFAAVMAVFLLVMGILSIIYIRAVNAFTVGVSISPRTIIRSAEMHFRSPDGGASSLFGSYRENEKLAVSFNAGAVGKEYTEWIFRDVNPDDFDENVKAVFRMKVLKNDFPAPTPLKVIVVNESDKPAVEPYITITDFYYKKNIEVEFSRKIIGSGREFRIILQRVDRRTSFEAQFDSVYILSEKRFFELNYFKGLGITFFGMLLIMGITVAASTVLSGPVNLLLGFFLYFSGSMLGFLKQALSDMQLAIRALEASSGHAGRASGETIPVWLMKISDTISSIAVSIIPDISRFDATSHILKGFDISAQVFTGSLYYALSYVLAAMLCAFVIMSFREFK